MEFHISLRNGSQNARPSILGAATQDSFILEQRSVDSIWVDGHKIRNTAFW
jgi:hypothetical protein